MNAIYTIKEVAKILGKHEGFIRSKIKKGHLIAVSLGHTYRIEEQSLQDFLNYSKQEENIDYSPCEHIDGITIEEFRKSLNIGLSLARNLIKKLVVNGTIKVFKVNNKLILPKDIYEKIGFIQNYCTESKDEPSKITTNTIPLFENNTLYSSSSNHNEVLSVQNTESDSSNDTLNIIKKIQRLSDMLKNGEISKNEFNLLKKALMKEA